MGYKRYFHASIERFEVSGATIGDQKDHFTFYGLKPTLISTTGKRKAVWSVAINNVEQDVAMEYVWETMKHNGIEIVRAGHKWTGRAIEIPFDAYEVAKRSHK